MNPEAAYLPDTPANADELRERARAVPEIDGDGQCCAAEQSAGTAVEVSEASDEQLLAQVQEGTKEAFGRLFRRHARSVRNVAYRILRDEAEADDLVQEIFLFIFRKAALFNRAQGTASTWIIHVAYHRAFDRRRYLNTRRFYSSQELDDVSLGTAGKRGTFPFHDQTLEGILGKQVLAELEEQLTLEQRETIRLYFFEGYSFKEIAELTGRSLVNVRSHYYRGLDRMRKSIFPDRLRSR